MFFVTFNTSETNVVLGHILLPCLHIIQIYSCDRKKYLLCDSFGQERVAMSGIDKEGDVDSALFLLFSFPSLFQISFPNFRDFFLSYFTNILLMSTIL